MTICLTQQLGERLWLDQIGRDELSLTSCAAPRRVAAASSPDWGELA
jgi:hypothetical protein